MSTVTEGARRAKTADLERADSTAELINGRVVHLMIRKYRAGIARATDPVRCRPAG